MAPMVTRDSGIEPLAYCGGGRRGRGAAMAGVSGRLRWSSPAGMLAPMRGHGPAKGRIRIGRTATHRRHELRPKCRLGKVAAASPGGGGEVAQALLGFARNAGERRVPAQLQ
jgi:hypothetical protein